jgi:protein-S-isoprenylcysteine O-methyltransferase Ste14
MLLGLALSLWFGCFASFGWATQKHFRSAGKFTVGMRWTLICGTAFSLLQGAAITTQPLSIVAAIFHLLALALFWWTICATDGKEFGACYASLDSKELVTSGPYRWIRHPFYTSYLLAWMAGGFVWPPLAVSVVAMGYIYWRAAEEEEARFLRGPWSVAYAAYQRRTGRFFISWASGSEMRRAAGEAIRSVRKIAGAAKGHPPVAGG